MTAHFLASIISFAAFDLQRDEAVDLIIGQLFGEPWKADLKSIPAELLPEVIARLRRVVDKSDPALKRKFEPYNWIDAKEVLLQLGDEQAIEEWASEIGRKVVDNEKFRLFSNDTYTQPLLIPILAENFFRNDGEEVIWGGIGGDVNWLEASASIGTAYNALSIMGRSPEFKAEVKEWAKAAQIMVLAPSRDVPKFRSVMRQWWRDNERHFQAKNYGAVQPGIPLLRPGSENDAPSAPSAPSPRAQTNPANPTSSPAISAEPASSPYILPAAIGISLLAAGAWSAVMEEEQGGMKVERDK